jgi:hypothetical protein
MLIVIDMNLTPRWADFLTNAGHEARHWSSLGSQSAKDAEICEYARIARPVLAPSPGRLRRRTRARRHRYNRLDQPSACPCSPTSLGPGTRPSCTEHARESASAPTPAKPRHAARTSPAIPAPPGNSTSTPTPSKPRSLASPEPLSQPILPATPINRTARTYGLPATWANAADQFGKLGVTP